ncbi:DUF2461 domain-containing protein [Flavivirga spongiicola]|uniref:DUF2461 domain-containing protein n=1 Tax=Flavivirga spongiicola TaxID=421621 RepID=A0ABU7XQJ2_9FLAO|nr:DUF2461 domain-containing protein [Flavivirga sp. MEBiC05379]MDO5978050.1 DUF2461 domain-containing protein [Flavivirga sp. MEBiC05379]
MITKTYTEFFKELNENNNKEWFHANKKRYENDVKEPFLELLSELLPILHEWDNRILTDEKKALFRINRDVRFSKDKTPYHTILKAGFSPNGKKSMLPGYYLGISQDSVHVGGGLFNVKPPELKVVRNHIANSINDFLTITKAKEFSGRVGRLKGDVSKRIDKAHEAVANKTQLIYNKQFYAMSNLSLANYYNSPNLKEDIIKHFNAIRPLNEFLNAAF